MIRSSILTLILSSLLPVICLGQTPSSVSTEARPAVAVVDRFFAALSEGDLEQVGSLLDPAVVILESGSAENSAAEYLGGHAKGDVEFLKGAKHTLLRRTAHASGDTAWVASESELVAQNDGKPVTLASTETMVLRSGKDGWKIVHIHWSSHVKKPGESH